MISFKTPRFIHACSKNTSTSRWKSAASIANDWNFPDVQAVACAILVCKLKQFEKAMSVTQIFTVKRLGIYLQNYRKSCADIKDALRLSKFHFGRA
jgi:hypothetical protein